MASVPAILGPTGLLVPALVGAAHFARCLGCLAFSRAPRRVRVLGGVTLALAFYTACLQLLFYTNGVRLPLLLAVFLASLAAAHFAVRRRRTARREELFASPDAADPYFSRAAGPLVAVTVAGLGLVLLAAYWLPVWAWDSLGYHLPFVNFVLQGGGLAELPRDVPYLSTYPRNGELLFVALRALLPDDRLIDVGQIPLGLLGGMVTFGIARELGARRVSALCAGSTWLLVPAVFLQLPTNYIDVATATFFLLAAFFLLRPPSPAGLLCAGLAIGLFLGSKPSAPPAAALLCLTLQIRAARAGLAWTGVAALGLVGALGLEAYVTEMIRHGNPVWPAILKLGPFELPGTISVRELLSSGAGAQKVHGSLPSRILQSWSSFDAHPIFDMRKGGLGAAFWLSLPPALYFVVRGRRWLLGALIVTSVVTPDPAVARYVLGLPALLLAAAFAALDELVDVESRTRSAVLLLAGAFGAHALAYAAPGLCGEGPPLAAYARMSWAERAVAVGANGRPTDFVEARGRLRAGEVAVYDRALWLPYLLWRSDLANKVVRIPDDASIETIDRILEQEQVRLLVVGRKQPAAVAARRAADRFLPVFECREPCTAYARP